MKRILPLIFIGLLSLPGLAQKAKFDKFRIPVQTSRFPDLDLPIDKRTVKVIFSGDPFYNSVVDNLEINNMEIKEENPAVIVKVHVNKLRKNEVSSSSRKSEKKDKDGKVISTTTYYTGSSSNSASGFVSVLGGADIPKFIYVTAAEKEREEKRLQREEELREKREAKKKEKSNEESKEPEEENPFLANIDTEGSDANANEIDEEEEESTPTDQLARYNITQTYNFSTSESTSKSRALQEAKSKRDNSFADNEIAFLDYFQRNAIRTVNGFFNYTKRVTNAYFYIMDAKKHPENTKFIQATEAAKVILGKMRYNKPNDEVAQELEPIMKYYSSLIKKYSIEDKKQKRIRTYSLYNLAKINYFLENTTELERLGQILVSDGDKKSAGEDFIEKADYLVKRNNFYNRAGRYPAVFEDEASDKDVEMEEDQEEEADSLD